MSNIEVRKPFRFLPAIAWAILIDAIDIFGNAVSLILMAVFIPLGLVPDVGIDLIQSLLGLLVFENFTMTLGGSTDFLLPPPLDLLPTYTFTYLALTRGKKR
jgi:hypothetical protein